MSTSEFSAPEAASVSIASAVSVRQREKSSAASSAAEPVGKVAVRPSVVGTAERVRDYRLQHHVRLAAVAEYPGRNCCLRPHTGGADRTPDHSDYAPSGRTPRSARRLGQSCDLR
jgi:hypothetical protein